MKLLFVIDHFGGGGAQRQMTLLASGLSDLGHKVEFFIYHPDHAFYRSLLDEKHIRIHSYDKKHRFSIKVLTALLRVVKTGGYDGMLSFLDTPNLYAEIIRMVNSIPLVVSMRMSPPGQWGFKDRLRLQCHRRADLITVNSRHQRRLLEDQFSWVSKHIKTIFNGVDCREFAPEPEKRCRNVLSGRMNLLGIGRIAEQKNLTGLVEALRVFRDKHGWVPMVSWVGKTGKEADEQRYYLSVKASIKEARLDEHWQWMGERRDIPALLNRADALIHPALYEGLPNAVCEALAAGCPVLAGNICDNPFLVNHGVTGLLFDPAQPRDISGAMSAYASLPVKEREKMSREARVYALDNLALDRYAREYERIFMKLRGSVR
jgi:glycosyltransferase involved in cell wall biosynthesis